MECCGEGRNGEGMEWERGKLCAHNEMINISYTIEKKKSFFLRYIFFPLPLQFRKLSRQQLKIFYK